MRRTFGFVVAACLATGLTPLRAVPPRGAARLADHVPDTPAIAKPAASGVSFLDDLPNPDDTPSPPPTFFLQQQPQQNQQQPPPRESAQNSQNAANNPLTPKLTINFHNYYIPSFYGLDGQDSDQFLLRGLVPHDLFGAPQLLRFTLPFANVPTGPSDSDTGMGDLTLIDLVMFKAAGLEFGVGPLAVFPTATETAVGQGKWQAGAAAVAVKPEPWGILGGLVTFQQSFAGDTDRDDVTLLTFQPIAIYNLPHGLYLRSTPIWNFDLNNGTYYVPVGLGLGKVWDTDKVTINAFVEPQYTLFHDGLAPQWQIFVGLNFQFPLRR